MDQRIQPSKVVLAFIKFENHNNYKFENKGQGGELLLIQ